MAFVLSQEGAEHLWLYILGIATPVQPFVHLLGSAFSPAHGTNLAAYAAAELPLVAGYAPIQLTNPGANWSLAPVAAGAQASYITLSWTFTAALPVFGYYLSDDTAHIGWGGEVWTPSYAFPAGGGLFTLSLAPYLISCPGVSAC